MKKYKKFKRIMIRPRPMDNFPDHQQEYEELYKMFDKVAKEVELSDHPSTIIRYIMKCRSLIMFSGQFPYYKYRLYSGDKIMNRIANYFDNPSRNEEINDR